MKQYNWSKCNTIYLFVSKFQVVEPANLFAGSVEVSAGDFSKNRRRFPALWSQPELSSWAKACRSLF